MFADSNPKASNFLLGTNATMQFDVKLEVPTYSSKVPIYFSMLCTHNGAMHQYHCVMHYYSCKFAWKKNPKCLTV